MTAYRLRTPRLELVPCPADVARAALERTPLPPGFPALPPDWPDAEAAPIFDGQLMLLAATPELACWGVWLVQRDGEIVGDAGFKGAPDEDAVVEIGYGIRASHRRHGFAAEAVGALVGWAFAHGARRVRAEVHRDNEASRRVLARLGFRFESAHDDHDWFEIAHDSRRIR